MMRTASLVLDAIGPFGVRLVGPAPAALSANPVVAPVAGDTIGPSGEGGGVLQPADVSADGDPGLLKRVPGGVPAAGQPPGVAPEPFLPSADQLVKRTESPSWQRSTSNSSVARCRRFMQLSLGRSREPIGSTDSRKS